MEITHGNGFRFIHSGAGAGAYNMALDEALSIGVASGPPVLRFYRFSPSTLSIGRFQRTDGRFHLDRIRADGLDFVRRPTGGQAVLHADELTYSVIIGRDHACPFRKRELYRVVSSILIDGLRRLGVEAAFSRSRVGNPVNPDCFGTTGEYEIVAADRRKLIGSAQCTTRIGALQHGSIPLESSRSDLARYLVDVPMESSESTSLAEQMGRTAGLDEVIEAFRDAFAASWTLRTSEVAPDEVSTASDLERVKYSTDTWTFRY